MLPAECWNGRASDQPLRLNCRPFDASYRKLLLVSAPIWGRKEEFLNHPRQREVLCAGLGEGRRSLSLTCLTKTFVRHIWVAAAQLLLLCSSPAAAAPDASPACCNFLGFVWRFASWFCLVSLAIAFIASDDCLHLCLCSLSCWFILPKFFCCFLNTEFVCFICLFWRVHISGY